MTRYGTMENISQKAKIEKANYEFVINSQNRGP